MIKQISKEMKNDLLQYHFMVWVENRKLNIDFFAHKAMNDFLKVYGEYFRYEKIK